MHVACGIGTVHNTSTIPPETTIANPLLRYRLRWYAVSTARLLLLRWQALVLAQAIGADVIEFGALLS